MHQMYNYYSVYFHVNAAYDINNIVFGQFRPWVDSVPTMGDTLLTTCTVKHCSSLISDLKNKVICACNANKYLIFRVTHNVKHLWNNNNVNKSTDTCILLVRFAFFDYFLPNDTLLLFYDICSFEIESKAIWKQSTV